MNISDDDESDEDEATHEFSSDGHEFLSDGGGEEVWHVAAPIPAVFNPVPDYRELHKEANYWEGAVPFLDSCSNKLVSKTSFVLRVYDSVNKEFTRGILKAQTLADVLCKLVKTQDRITEAEWPNVIFEICARILPCKISNPDIIPQAKHDIMFYINNHCGGIANIKHVPHLDDLNDYRYNDEDSIVDVTSGDVVEDDDHLEDLIALVKKQKKTLSTNQ